MDGLLVAGTGSSDAEASATLSANSTMIKSSDENAANGATRIVRNCSAPQTRGLETVPTIMLL